MESVLSIVRPDSLADIFIYIVFILGFIILAVMPEKNTQPQYLMYLVLFFCLLDLVRNSPGATAALRIPGFDNAGFATFLIHIMMAIFPMVAGGMSRKQGKKGGAVLPLGVITGLLAGLYAIGSFLSPNSFYSAIF